MILNYIFREFKVPHDYKQEHAFLSMYRPKVATRVIPNLPGVPKSQPAAANGATNGHGWVLSSLDVGLGFISDHEQDLHLRAAAAEEHEVCA